MDKIKSFGIILGIWAIGEVISYLIRSFASIPGSVIGMIILFVLLMSGVIKLSKIEEVANFFLSHITIFIIPFGIAFVKYWDVIKQNFLLMLLCGVVSTIVSFVLTMKFVDLCIYIANKIQGGKTNE